MSTEGDLGGDGDGITQTTICEIDDGENVSQQEDQSKPKISFILTMFNIMCSAIGIGVLFLPSTLCGTGIYLGVALIILIGLAADWSSRALIEVTCKTKSKSLEDMFKKVLGPRAGHVYSISVFFLLIGALSIFIVMMGMQLNDFYHGLKGKKLMDYKLMSLMFSTICGVSLLLKDLKVLSYVSIVKIGVIIFIFLVSVLFARSEYDRRRVEVGRGPGTFYEEFPVTPTLLGLMKAMGSLQTAYLFHMGVSDMYFSMEKRSYFNWSKVSRLSCFLIAILNVGFAVVGYLATADQLQPTGGTLDLCDKGGIFLSFYANKNKLGQALIDIARFLIVFILMASYPLIFYFLKEYTILIIKNLYPTFYASKSKDTVNNVTTFGVWFLILCASCSTDDPFTITDIVVSVVGTIAVFLMPVLCWIQINGGFVYVFSLGLGGKHNVNENIRNKNIIDVKATDNTRDTTVESEIDIEPECSYKKPSIIGMLSAQSVFLLSCAFIIIGLSISSMELYQKGCLKRGGIKWRQSQFPAPK